MTRPPAAAVGRGLALMALAMLIVPVMDALAKLAAERLPPLEIAFARMAVQMVLALAVAAATGAVRGLLPAPLALHMARGFCLGAATLMFFTALTAMPMADAIAVFFVQPMILTALSALILKESVGWRRWTACATGFLGAMVIVRPGSGVFQAHALLPLGSACLFAGYLLLTRRLSGSGGLLAAQFVTGLAGTLLLGAALLGAALAGLPGAAPRLPDGLEWAMLAAIGLISFGAHALVVRAFDHAPAAVLAPLNYLEIVSATALGYLIFADLPDGQTWAGIGLIVASGLYIARREHLRRAR